MKGLSNKPRETRDRFTKTVEETKQRYGEYFNGLLARIDQDAETKQGWAALKSYRKSIPIGNSLRYLQQSLDPIHAMHIGFGETKRKMDGAKRLLVRNTFARPDDLSKFYRTLRNENEVSFGELVSDTVSQLYALQDPEKHSLLSQLVYIQAAAAALFPEVPEPASPRHAALYHGKSFASDNVSANKVLPRDPKDVRLIRMLKDDFELLATMELVTDYYKNGLAQTRHGDVAGQWTMPYGPLDKFFVGKVGRKTSAYLDIPAIRHVSEYATEHEDELKRSGVSDAYMDLYHYMQYVALWTRFSSLRDVERQMYFAQENTDEMEKLPTVDWHNIHFAREVPSCQRVFFENNQEPLFVTVDQAPGKAYVATVSITSAHKFAELETRVGSMQAARELVNPLTKPFTDASYMDARSFSFYVRKDDGELCMYGDSSYLAKAQLGAHYDACKRLIHYIMYNLAHTEYVVVPPQENADGQEARTQIVDQPMPLPVVSIPDSPTVREVPNSDNVNSVEGRAFLGRRAHTRLLPSGWMPSYTAWSKARTSEGVDLYAVLFDQDAQKVLQNIKLDLKEADFVKFRENLQQMQVIHGNVVRFETYVSEAEVDESETAAQSKSSQ